MANFKRAHILMHVSKKKVEKGNTMKLLDGIYFQHLIDQMRENRKSYTRAHFI